MDEDMSKATKRKHVAREVLEQFITPNENQQIVKVMAGRGNNLHEVLTASGETHLASMPPKFRKNVWIKRGDYVVTEPIEEGDKVKAEIVHVLYKHQIRHLKEEHFWPVEFAEKGVASPSPNRTLDRDSDDGDESSDAEDDRRLFVNTNRPTLAYEESSDNGSSDASTDVEN